jgi:hypothetical protein
MPELSIGNVRGPAISSRPPLQVQIGTRGCMRCSDTSRDSSRGISLRRKQGDRGGWLQSGGRECRARSRRCHEMGDECVCSPSLLPLPHTSLPLPHHTPSPSPSSSSHLLPPPPPPSSPPYVYSLLPLLPHQSLLPSFTAFRSEPESLQSHHQQTGRESSFNHYSRAQQQLYN